jgi:hypothetical protein
MPANYVAAGLQPLRQAIADISAMTPDVQMQNFTLRRQDFGALALVDEITREGRLITETERERIGNTMDLTVNAMQLQNVYEQRAAGVNTELQRQGVGSMNPTSVNVSYNAGIEEGMDNSFGDNILRSVGSSPDTMDADSRAGQAYQQEFTRNFVETIKLIYQRMNDETLAYIDANRWTVSAIADAGTIYAPAGVGDFKEIPAVDAVRNSTADFPVFIQRVARENRQNVFGQGGTPYILYGAEAGDKMERYGESNMDRLVQYGNQFQGTEDFRVVNPAGYQGTFYTIAHGGLAMFLQNPYPYLAHPEAENGAFVAGNDVWSMPITVGRGTSLFPDMPRITLNHKIYKGWADNGNGVLNNDIVMNHSFHVRQGYMHAYDQNGATPIIKYQILV